MATNAFFNNYDNFGEQEMFKDLVEEFIQIYGVDVVYITREIGEVDEILNEARLSIFDTACDIEMYVKTADNFGGEGDFLSKFGLQINDQVTFSVSVRAFEKYVTEASPKTVRPMEGDVIWFPMTKKMYKLMHAEHEGVFYQHGTLASFDLKCELMEFSNERFQTGRPEIDTYFDDVRTDDVMDIDTLFDVDPIAKNKFFEDESHEILDFSETSPFDEVITYPGRK